VQAPWYSSHCLTDNLYLFLARERLVLFLAELFFLAGRFLAPVFFLAADRFLAAGRFLAVFFFLAGAFLVFFMITSLGINYYYLFYHVNRVQARGNSLFSLSHGKAPRTPRLIHYIEIRRQGVAVVPHGGDFFPV
jgi:hypothetical protein